MIAHQPSVAEIYEMLRRSRFRFNKEKSLQEAMESAFIQAGYEFQREFNLTSDDCIDFYFPTLKLGIEVKCDGSPTSVLSQLLRYAQSEQIDSLMLVTSKMSLTAPAQLHDKPIAVLRLWNSCL